MKKEKIKTSSQEEKGRISVDTDKLFPIIKQWLYSEHDIFLRELISNAHDALRKLERLADLGEYEGKVPVPSIEIELDKPNKVLRIKDTGLGMTKEEIKKYINQIAFSGAEEFLKRYEKEEQKTNLIGHFGLGFFSAFMVAKKVEIDSLSYQKGATAARWSCSGTTEFELGEGKRDTIGTELTLFLNDESEEFLEEETIKGLVEKYSNFLPVPIKVNGKQVNEQESLWLKESKELKQEDYEALYQKLFPAEALEGPPLFSLPLSVDYPFKLKGILFFPKIKLDFDLNKEGRIKLFCNQVFVSDNVSALLPSYLGLLRGVLDSPDIPLNVSRSALQKDAKMKKLGAYLVKKIADKLKELFKQNREEYEKFYEALSPFIKIGALSDETFLEKTKEVFLLKNLEDKWVTLEEYQTYPEKKEKAVKEVKAKVIYYTSNREKEFVYLSRAQGEGIQVVVLDSPVDSHFMQTLEYKYSPLKFLRVDAARGEEAEKNEAPKVKPEKASAEIKAEETFISQFKESLGKKDLEVELQELADEALSGMVVVDEQLRRFEEMSRMMQRGGNGANPLGELAKHKLLLNTKSVAVKRLREHYEAGEKEAAEELAKNLYDLALLSANALKGEKLAAFIRRANELIKK